MKPQKFLALVQPILKLVIGFLLNSNDYCVYTLVVEKVAFR